MKLKVLRIVKRIVEVMVKCFYYCLTMVSPVKEKRILFVAFHGRGVVDSPKALYEYMRSHDEYKDYDLIFTLNKPVDGIKSVKYRSLEFLKAAATSKYWFFNCKMPGFLYKKNNQIYLQTWHGTPLKRLGHDIIVDKDQKISRSGLSQDKRNKEYDVDSARYNYMISPNAFSTGCFESAFNVKRDKLIETGYPRNDFLTNVTPDEITAIKKKYNVPEGKKVIFYAPTFRDNAYNTEGYTFKLEVDFRKWKDILGDEYVVLFKPHYLIVTDFKEEPYTKGFVKFIDANADINELYVISDMLITDYSSVFFDYAILNRPIYFYMYDIDEYEGMLRGFYLNVYEDLPGKIYKEEESMLKAIKREEFDKDAMELFRERFSYLEDGNATKRVLDIVLGNK